MDIVKLEGDLEILVDYRNEPTVTLRGEVDFRNRDRLREAISNLADGCRASVNVDLRELIFMDSTGVSALVDAARALLNGGRRVNLVGPSAQLLKVLAESDLSGIFGVDAARQSLPEPVDSPVVAREEMEFEVPGRPEMIAHIRNRVADFARALPFAADEIEDIKLAVGEASANALRHGLNPQWPMVGVRVQRLADGVDIRIRDRGCGFDPESVCSPPNGDLVEGGRGIMFMRALMDEVKFCFCEPGTEVCLIKFFGSSRS